MGESYAFFVHLTQLVIKSPCFSKYLRQQEKVSFTRLSLTGFSCPSCIISQANVYDIYNTKKKALGT